MKRYVLTCFLLLLSPVVFSDYSGGHDVSRLYISKDGQVSFGTSPQATNTCNYYNFHFKFDSSTAGGKSLLSLLLSAKLSKSKIDVWYSPSLNPGTNHTNGCSNANIANVSNIGIR